MPNTREKLIELICRVMVCEDSPSKLLIVAQILADHLIANGVTFDKDINALTKKIAELEKSNRNWRRKMQKIRQRYAKNDADKWISVKERLPESRDFVLGYMSFGEYRTLKWKNETHQWEGLLVDYEMDFVTHWMPLPEPQKGE